MATPKQIAANRRNATRSTGPRTAAGKSSSSRNALLHGLSLPPIRDATTIAKLEELMTMIGRDEFDDQRLSAANGAASAVLDQIRIRQVRMTMLEKIDFETAPSEQLRRLLALDRYERRAMTKRRRASAKLVND
jgi:hypothetical protein